MMHRRRSFFVAVPLFLSTATFSGASEAAYMLPELESVVLAFDMRSWEEKEKLGGKRERRCEIPKQRLRSFTLHRMRPGHEKGKMWIQLVARNRLPRRTLRMGSIPLLLFYCPDVPLHFTHYTGLCKIYTKSAAFFRLSRQIHAEARLSAIDAR